MATDNHAPGAEQKPGDFTETRTLAELIALGFVGHVEGIDGAAEIDVPPPRNAQEAATRKWQDHSLPLAHDEGRSERRDHD